MDEEQTLVKENIDELIDRCGKMRLLDEKHAEAEFIEGKMKMLQKIRYSTEAPAQIDRDIRSI